MAQKIVGCVFTPVRRLLQSCRSHLRLLWISHHSTPSLQRRFANRCRNDLRHGYGPLAFIGANSVVVETGGKLPLLHVTCLQRFSWQWILTTSVSTPTSYAKFDPHVGWNTDLFIMYVSTCIHTFHILIHNIFYLVAIFPTFWKSFCIFYSVVLGRTT